MDTLPKDLQDVSILRRIIFAAAYLPRGFPHYWSVIVEFVNQANKAQLTVHHDDVKTAVENLQFVNEKAFTTDMMLAKELHSMVPDSLQPNPLGIVLISRNEICRLCGSKLLIRSERASHVTIYTETFGTVVGTHYHKYCQKFRKGCSFRQFYGYSSEGSQSVTLYDSDWADHTYFISSSETAFEMILLRKFDTELLIGQVSYSQKAEIYNYFHGYPVLPKKCSTLEEHEIPVHSASTETTDNLQDRIRMDRRRLEVAHLRYAVLTVQKRYPSVAVGPIPILTDISSTLEKFNIKFYEAFSQRYSEHRCDFPGCKTVMVLDGNMKNQREICLAKDAGYISYPGLPGHIKTGCMASPSFKSRFCLQHKVRSCMTSSQKGEPAQSPHVCSTAPQENAVVEMILGVRETRGDKYYQVLWLGTELTKVTWEPASSLPQTVIQEFNSGVESKVVEQKRDCYGKEVCTLVSVQSQVSECPVLKKPQTDQPVVQSNKGAFDDSVKVALSCKTEKDLHVRLNLRTAGILAGMRPCGVIVLLSKLFTSESKSQVYGCLHNYYALHPSFARDIEFICYDDACHLKRFARNPVRANLTDCTR